MLSRFSKVLDYRTYRLRNKKATHRTREARKMGRMARNMKHSFAGYPRFPGKAGLKVFTWRRKRVKDCNDNRVSGGMALSVIPHFFLVTLSFGTHGLFLTRQATLVGRRSLVILRPSTGSFRPTRNPMHSHWPRAGSAGPQRSPMRPLKPFLCVSGA